MIATGASATDARTEPDAEQAAVFVMDSAHFCFAGDARKGTVRQMTKDIRGFTKELLKSYRWLPPMIEKAEKELSDINSEIQVVLRGRSGGNNVGGRTGPGDPTGMASAEVEQLSAVKCDIERRLSGYRRKKAWIEQSVAALPDKERYIVEERYFRGARHHGKKYHVFFHFMKDGAGRCLAKAIEAVSEMYLIGPF